KQAIIKFNKYRHLVEVLLLYQLGQTAPMPLTYVIIEEILRMDPFKDTFIVFINHRWNLMFRERPVSRQYFPGSKSKNLAVHIGVERTIIGSAQLCHKYTAMDIRIKMAVTPPCHLDH